ncbi:MAG TPA: tetratricopeptide repeat protein [Pyrinomonadaceae bacterium]|jgi:tetratricopeptide (TPR) repeat protein
MSTPHVARLIASFLLLLGAALCVSAQGGNTLEGRVTLPDGAPPPNPVRIKLTLNGRPIYETFSDLSGRFSFGSLSKGSYRLTAESDGISFETTTVEAEVSAFGAGSQTFSQNIQLLPKRTKGQQAAGVVNAFSQDVPKAARTALERAQKLSREGKSPLALTMLQEALKLFPDYFEALLAFANELIQAGRFDEAITPLERARQINPQDERVYQSFGLVLMQQKKYAIAVAVFAEASRLNSTNPLNALMRATALIYHASTIDITASEKAASDRAFFLERAEIALKQTAELSGKKLSADHLTMAKFYEMKNERARAADELEQYLRKAPDARNADSIREAIRLLRSAATESNRSAPKP